MAFATLVLCNLGLILANRSRRGAAWSALRRPNPMLWAVVAGTLALLGAALYWPWAAGLLRFAPLPASALGAAAALALVNLALLALLKWMTPERA
jgi:Ca2+-transporting ATPase